MFDPAISVTLQDHGSFYTTLSEAKQSERLGKAELAGRISRMYGGTGNTSRMGYWLGFTKGILAIVHASLEG
jgi:hypothetical protein